MYIKGKKINKKDIERFLSHTSKSGECVIWGKSKNKKGYGYFSITVKKGIKKNVFAHRFSYVINNGVIPADNIIMHTCDNSSCVNPAHLKLGTIHDNNIDRDIKGRHVALKGVFHGMSKLKDEDVIKIRGMYSSGEYSQRRLANLFKVNQRLIFNIIHKINWSHI